MALSLVAVSFIVVPVSGQRRRTTLLVDGHEAAAREVLVKFREGRSNTRLQLKDQVDVDDDRPVGSHGARRWHSRRFDVDALVSFLRSFPDVEYAEPNYILHATVIPDDPRFPELWGLRNIGQTVGGVAGTAGADIGASNAWDIATGTTANVVGVIDTGVDYTHPDLVPNMWSAPAGFT